MPINVSIQRTGFMSIHFRCKQVSIETRGYFLGYLDHFISQCYYIAEYRVKFMFSGAMLASTQRPLSSVLKYLSSGQSFPQPLQSTKSKYIICVSGEQYLQLGIGPCRDKIPFTFCFL